MCLWVLMLDAVVDFVVVESLLNVAVVDFEDMNVRRWVPVAVGHVVSLVVVVVVENALPAVVLFAVYPFVTVLEFAVDFPPSPDPASPELLRPSVVAELVPPPAVSHSSHAVPAVLPYTVVAPLHASFPHLPAVVPILPIQAIHLNLLL